MKSEMNVEKIDKISEMLNIYINDEKMVLENIKSVLLNFKYSYSTDSSASLDNLNDQIIGKFSSIMKVHDSDLVVLNKNREKYIDVSKKVEMSFEDLGKR